MEQALDLYRRNYRPSERHPEPQNTFWVWALGAHRAADARWLGGSRAHARVEREYGVRRALVPPEEAAARSYSAAERAFIESMRERAIVGTAEQVASGLDALAARLALDELVIVTWTYDPEPRHRSYELLAEAYGLTRQPSPTHGGDAP